MKEKKGKFKVNNFFLYPTLNLFDLFNFSTYCLNNVKMHNPLTNFNYI